MKELVEFLAKSIVENKDDVKVTVNEASDEINIDLYVNPDDIGRVIGKGGKVVKAIRLIVGATLKDSRRINLEIKE
ncbi:KH domain-containing protein [Fenollaria sporofastidiosus]|uniref:KH domain-containing protein n=1 Tax=Fenollaria sporofastidiosus TaxID=2811778 RepID=UPI001C005E73|nr:KH domain-containing protein [Fenollaria sporofastidiosus]